MADHRNLSGKVYESLRQDILGARIAPGARLSEIQLAGRFGVSRAPIRDAITRLQEDHLVQVRPQVGTIVCPISEDMAMNILEVRICLEPHAAQMAAPKLTKEDRELLCEHFDRLARLDRNSEARRRKLFETDTLLHNLIWERCGNPEIKRILDRYRGETQRIRLSNAALGHRLAPSEKEIRAIFEALKRRNGARAATALSLHLKNIRKAVKSIFAVRRREAEGELREEKTQRRAALGEAGNAGGREVEKYKE